jgi:hypothetical protein
VLPSKVTEVDAGRFQKFRPRAGGNPAMLVGSAWQQEDWISPAAL